MSSEENPVNEEKCTPASYKIMHTICSIIIFDDAFYIEFPYFEVIYS